MKPYLFLSTISRISPIPRSHLLSLRRGFEGLHGCCLNKHDLCPEEFGYFQLQRLSSLDLYFLTNNRGHNSGNGTILATNLCVQHVCFEASE